MELLDERPIWSMSGSEMLSTLDQLDALLARLQTQRLQLIAGLETVGYAEEIGAHDTVQLLAFRYRLDRPEARRDVRLARPSRSTKPSPQDCLPSTEMTRRSTCAQHRPTRSSRP